METIRMDDIDLFEMVNHFLTGHSEPAGSRTGGGSRGAAAGASTD